jgi:hypothetical protein
MCCRIRRRCQLILKIKMILLLEGFLLESMKVVLENLTCNLIFLRPATQFVHPPKIFRSSSKEDGPPRDTSSQCNFVGVFKIATNGYATRNRTYPDRLILYSFINVECSSITLHCRTQG